MLCWVRETVQVLDLKKKLKHGLEVEILDSPARIPVEALQKFINRLIAEEAWILRTNKVSLNEEKLWKKEKITAIRKGQVVFTAALHANEVAGMCEARKQTGRDGKNVGMAIGVSNKFRRKGLGEFLLLKTVEKARKKFKPNNIFLTVAEPNKGARKLYAKVGFRKIARFPDWIENNGKYYAQLWMVLK